MFAFLTFLIVAAAAGIYLHKKYLFVWDNEKSGDVRTFSIAVTPRAKNG